MVHKREPRNPPTETQADMRAITLVCSRVVEGAKENFNWLVDRGADANFLLAWLTALADYVPVLDTHASLTGFEPRALRTVVKRMRRCAEDIERLNAQFSVQPLLSAIGDRAVSFRVTATALRLYADWLDGVPHVRRPGRHPFQNICAAHIVQHVIQKTRKPHDKHVAALFSAVLDKPSYDETVHKTWRHKHADLIRVFSQ